MAISVHEEMQTLVIGTRKASVLDENRNWPHRKPHHRGCDEKWRNVTRLSVGVKFNER